MDRKHGKALKVLVSTSPNFTNYRLALESLGVQVVGGYLPQADPDCDALILCGGSDIDPSLYGQENRGSVEIDARRDEAEWKLLDDYKDKPIFGICRGCQMINAYFGGTLIQDIQSSVRHGADQGDSYHRVITEAGSLMETLYGSSFCVNSSHHQAVDKVAKGFRITLRSEADGIAEAIEHEDRPIFAVQWHPERTALSFRSERAVDGITVLRAFLEICGRYR